MLIASGASGSLSRWSGPDLQRRAVARIPRQISAKVKGSNDGRAADCHCGGRRRRSCRRAGTGTIGRGNRRLRAVARTERDRRWPQSQPQRPAGAPCARRRGRSDCPRVGVRFSDHPELEEWAGHLVHAQRLVFGAPNLTVHRADLLAVVRGALKTVDFRLGARCIAVEECDRGGVVRLADGGEIEADIIVGADGIHSVVRKSLFGPDAPRFTGCICWRGMATASAVPRDIAIAEGAMWMGPHGHVVHYPVRRGELINIVAHFDSDSWTEESWTRECDMSELTTTYAGWHPNLLRLYPYSARWYKWALYDRDPVERWSKGRVTLLGDSAHAMLPYLGQGAAM